MSVTWDTPGTVYLLHFDRPFRHARHYIGWAKDLDHRIGEHERGQGARLVAAAKRAGIGFTVARVWPDSTIRDERRLKKARCAPNYCPLCVTHGGPAGHGYA